MKREYGFRAKKGLGQHFLKDKEVVREIISKAGFDRSDQVLEIGPGLGALTLSLSRRVHRVIAVEKDLRLTEMLKKRLSVEKTDNVCLINEDILKLNFNRIPSLPEKSLKDFARDWGLCDSLYHTQAKRVATSRIRFSVTA